MSQRFRRLVAIATLVSVAYLLVIGGAGEARKDGVSGRAEVGCTCHGGGTPDTSVTPLLEGVPARWEPATTYHLTMGISGGPPYSNGGFNLNASAGRLNIPAGEANAFITTTSTFGGAPGEATHKSPAARSWKVDWTAPGPGAGRISFRLATNSVNGNSQPDALDKWNLVSKTSDEHNLPPQALKLAAPRLAGPGRVNLSWTGVLDTDVVRLEVLQGAKAGFPGAGAAKAASISNVKVTSVEVQKLATNSTYYFRLRTVDKGGLTTDSNEVSIRVAPLVATPAAVPAHAAAKAPGAAALPSLIAVMVVLPGLRTGRRAGCAASAERGAGPGNPREDDS